MIGDMSMKLIQFISIFTILFIFGCTKEQPPAQAPAQPVEVNTQAVTSSAPAAAPVVVGNVDLSVDKDGLSKATIVLKTNKGTMKFKFFAEDAPNTSKRFVELVQSKFYDGLAFHRVEPGFVVQGGDPKSRNKNDPAVGTGGSGQKLKAEFNKRHHMRGVVAMARSRDPDSADSQFYICLGSFPHLDGQYTIIGKVVDYGEKVDGKDVLDRILPWDTIDAMTVE